MSWSLTTSQKSKGDEHRWIFSLLWQNYFARRNGKMLNCRNGEHISYCNKNKWWSIMTKKASLFCWLILVVVWSRVLCSEVYLVGSWKTHVCEASFSADKRRCWWRGSGGKCCKRDQWSKKTGIFFFLKKELDYYQKVVVKYCLFLN